MKTVLALLLCTLSLMSSSDLSNSEVVKKMIQEIQQASDKDRFEKMNAFKSYLRELNAKERKEAIVKLQNSLNKQHSSNQMSNVEKHKQTQLQESQQQLQMQHQMQNQNQIKNQGSGGQMMKKP